MKHKSLIFASILGTALSSQAATVISFNFGNTVMPATETAGAGGGAGANNWNRVEAAGMYAAGTLEENGGATASGVALSLTRVNSNVTGATGMNDSRMFNSSFDIFNNTSSPINSVSEMSAAITGISFASYDVYVYTHGQFDTRGGEIWANGFLTGTRKSLRHLGSGHSTYVEVDDSDPFNSITTEQGTYVKFSGLTGSTLTLDWDTEIRFPQSGLQIVEVIPEPSSTALLGLGGLALILRRRK